MKVTAYKKRCPNVEHIKETYRIQYVDNTYQLVDWTNDSFEYVYEAMAIGKHIAMIDKCIFRLTDIRAIVHIPPEPEEEPVTEEDEEGMVITEMGKYDREMYELLVSMGYGAEMGEVKGVK